jgi:hypothetical protein
MLFAAYPGPTGYAPPPKKSANPALIVLGVCGGCILLLVIGGVIGGLYINHAAGPFIQRTISAAKFTTNLKLQKYADAEQSLSPQIQQEYNADALQKKVAALEKKYGPMTGVAQVTNVDKSQPDPTKITTISYNLNFQNGVITLKMTFDTTPGQEAKIIHLDWGTDESDGSGSGGGGSGGSNQ